MSQTDYKFLDSNKIVFLFLMLLGFIIYHESVFHEFVRYDDQVYFSAIVQNDSGFLSMLFWALTNNVNANWHPLTVISLIIDYKIYGEYAGGYHLTSTIFHILNSFLLFLVTRSLFNRNIAFVVAAIFLAHPLSVETVAWVSERKGVLAAFFALLSLQLFLVYKSSQKRRYYYYSIIAFLFALMSKAVFVTLPFLFFVIEIFLSQKNNLVFKKETLKKYIFETSPFFAISLVIGLITVFAHDESGALGINVLYPIDVRIQKAIATIPIYIRQLIYPVDLYLPVSYTVPSTIDVLSGILVLVIFSFIAFKYIRSWPFIFLGWFWYLFLLLPVSGIIQSGFHAHADRYAYLPMVGIILIFTVSISKILKTYNVKNSIVIFVSVLLLVYLSVISALQHSYWKNTATLFYHAYSIDNKNYMANTLLAGYYISINDLDTGMQYYKQARDSAPTYVDLYAGVSLSLISKQAYDQASMVLSDGMKVISVVEQQNARILRNYKIHRDKVLIQKAKLHIHRKEYNQAIKHLELSLTYAPNNPELIFLKGKAYYLLDKNKAAENDFLTTINIHPQYYPAYEYLLDLYIYTKNSDSAKKLIKDMLAKFPEKKELINGYRKSLK